MTMDSLTSVLDEAGNISSFDMEPFNMDQKSGASVELQMIQKEMMQKARLHHQQAMMVAAFNKANEIKQQQQQQQGNWKKDNDKPKRPLSAYNLFFQHEREKIITSNPDAKFEETMHKIRNTPRPKKRRHRKSHGKIGFAELARTIAEKWKSLPKSEKQIFEHTAAEEKEKYQEELDKWSKAREEKAKIEEQKTPMERARVQVVYDEFNDDSATHTGSPKPLFQQSDSTMMLQNKLLMNPSNPQSLSALMLQGATRGASNNTGSTMNDVRDYLQMTQQTIEMARASLSLPLFANLGQAGQIGTNNGSTNGLPANAFQHQQLTSMMTGQSGPAAVSMDVAGSTTSAATATGMSELFGMANLSSASVALGLNSGFGSNLLDQQQQQFTDMSTTASPLNQMMGMMGTSSMCGPNAGFVENHAQF